MDSAYTWHYCRIIASIYQSRGTSKLSDNIVGLIKNHGFLFLFKGFLLVREANINQLHSRSERSIDLLYVSVILYLLHGVGANSHIHVDSIISLHQSNYTVGHHSYALHCQYSYSGSCYWLWRLNHLQTIQVTKYTNNIIIMFVDTYATHYSIFTKVFHVHSRHIMKWNAYYNIIYKCLKY